MAKLLMVLRHVPEDEIEEVRALLDAHGIGHYQTEPSRWGVSHGGLWLADDGDHAAARALLDGYQRERQARARAQAEQDRREGREERFVEQLRREPLRVLAAVAAILALLALMALPAWLLWP